MIERLRGKVEKVTFVKVVGQGGLNQCEIQIDFDVLTIYWPVDDLIKFMNKEVMYTVRDDYDTENQKQIRVVCELVEISTIQTVASTENVKLVPEGNKRTVCNVVSREIRFGDYYPNRVAYMSAWEMGSSKKARWYDCTMIDAESREFQVRLFATNVEPELMEEQLNVMKGGYVNFDLKSTKYGYQTDEIVGLPNAVELSPEVVLSETIIRELIQSDPALSYYDEKYHFVDAIKDVIDGEPGYQLVRMASELYMVNAVDNISTDLNIQAMKRAIICSRGYLLPHKTNWSRPQLNMTKVMGVPALKAERELLLMLDVLSEEEASSTKLTYIKIRGLVNDIISIRRGTENEKGVIDFAGIFASFNGLL